MVTLVTLVGNQDIVSEMRSARVSHIQVVYYTSSRSQEQGQCTIRHWRVGTKWSGCRAFHGQGRGCQGVR
jgi:hypothetical protein